MKANNAEFSEGARFRWLANADLSRQLKKKKMKALVPQIVQIVYFGALLIFCVGSLVVLGGSCDCCGMVSFITSLVFLIEPIQVITDINFTSYFLPCLCLKSFLVTNGICIIVVYRMSTSSH